MAATAISLRLQPKRPPITNPTCLHFFSSDSANPDDQNTPPPPPPPQQSPISSYFSDVKASLKQNPQPSQPRHRTQSLEEIRRNLSQFHRPSPAPPTQDNQSPPVSLQELYRRRSENSTIEAANRQGVASTKPSFDAIRESLRQLRNKNTNPANNPHPNQARDPMSLTDLKRDLKLRPGGPNNNSNVIGGTDKALPISVFGKEMAGRKEERESVGARTEFVRGYGYNELGEKLRKLRPAEGKRGSDWFSFGELNERLARLREAEEKEMEEKMTGIRFADLRESLMTLQMTEAKNKKQICERIFLF